MGIVKRKEGGTDEGDMKRRRGKNNQGLGEDTLSTFEATHVNL